MRMKKLMRFATAWLRVQEVTVELFHSGVLVRLSERLVSIDRVDACNPLPDDIRINRALRKNSVCGTQIKQ